MNGGATKKVNFILRKIDFTTKPTTEQKENFKKYLDIISKTKKEIPKIKKEILKAKGKILKDKNKILENKKTELEAITNQYFSYKDFIYSKGDRLRKTIKRKLKKEYKSLNKFEKLQWEQRLLKVIAYAN
mgnify:CR=1 FL=1